MMILGFFLLPAPMWDDTKTKLFPSRKSLELSIKFLLTFLLLLLISGRKKMRESWMVYFERAAAGFYDDDDGRWMRRKKVFALGKKALKLLTAPSYLFCASFNFFFLLLTKFIYFWKFFVLFIQHKMALKLTAKKFTNLLHINIY